MANRHVRLIVLAQTEKREKSMKIFVEKLCFGKNKCHFNVKRKSNFFLLGHQTNIRGQSVVVAISTDLTYNTGMKTK